jgi:hypothetical protein
MRVVGSSYDVRGRAPRQKPEKDGADIDADRRERREGYDGAVTPFVLILWIVAAPVIWPSTAVRCPRI